MKTILRVLFLVLLCGCASVNDDKPFSTLVKGTVEGKEGKYVLLLPQFQDPRTYSESQMAQITNGTFELRIEGDHIMRYYFMFLEELQRGSWYNIDFFPDAEEVEIIITSWPGEDRSGKHEFEVKGGNINREMTRYNDKENTKYDQKTDPLYKEIESLDRANNYLSDAAKELYAQLNETGNDRDKQVTIYDQLNKMRETGEDLSPEARSVVSQLKEYDRQRKEEMYDYIARDINLFSYSKLGGDMFFYGKEADPDIIIPLAEKYAKRYPVHPYTDFMADIIKGMAIRPGGKFIDFTVPDLDGKMHTLSEEIKGKIAYIDLWASWCSPCRVKSKRMIPIYNEYKEKGFTVVGVAREYKNTDALQIAIEQDGYTWLNLVDLDDANSIWSLYNAPNAAGKTVLVDKQGTIVAIDPSAEEVAEYLSSHLPD